MKRIILAILSFLTAHAVAWAQTDSQAKAILSQVSHKYRAYATLRTNFVVAVVNPQAETRGSQQGTLTSQQGTGKFRVTLYSPVSKNSVEQEIISDGKTQWTYLKKDNEVQISAVDNSAAGINPAQIFTMYDKGYKPLYTGEVKQDGITCQAVELSPVSASPGIFKVKLLIDKGRKLIHSAQLFDKNGSRYLYTLSNFVPNPKVAGGYFSFDAKAHPGIDVEDLR